MRRTWNSSSCRPSRASWRRRARSPGPGGPEEPMATDVLMPKLSDTMEEGKILKWLKQPGDRVKSGDLIAEVETDKANMEVESFDEGVVQELKVKEGDRAAGGGVIGVLGTERGAPAASKPAAAKKDEPKEEAKKEDAKK